MTKHVAFFTEAGDVFRIHFQRSLPSSGADEKPGMPVLDNEKASSIDSSNSGLSVGAFNPSPLRRCAKNSQEGNVGTLSGPGAGTAKELLYRHGPENTGLKPSLYNVWHGDEK